MSGAAWDWSASPTERPLFAAPPTIQDETLRDGIQSPSALDPPIERKIELLHLMERLGVDVVNVGLPASGERNRADVRALCREIDRARLNIRPVAAARTVVADVQAIVDASEEVGRAIDVYTFIGSSPIRQLAESWDLAVLRRHSAAAIDTAVRAGLRVAYVLEDTTRSRPEVLAALFRNAIDHGATRLCLADTVGHATPDGACALVSFTRNVIAASGAKSIGMDWHGHNDRGLVVACSIAALQAGADRVHGTALGVGERVGNAPVELLLWRLSAMKARPEPDRGVLDAYRAVARRALGFDGVSSPHA